MTGGKQSRKDRRDINNQDTRKRHGLNDTMKSSSLTWLVKGFHFKVPHILRYNHHSVDDERDLDSGALRK